MEKNEEKEGQERRKKKRKRKMGEERKKEGKSLSFFFNSGFIYFPRTFYYSENFDACGGHKFRFFQASLGM